jgi:SAM-dependent methyltransferase
MQIPDSFQPVTENNASTLTAESFDSWLMTQFVCPVDHAPLVREGNWMINVQNPLRRYPIAHGIPVFLRDDIEHTAWWSRESLAQATRIANGVEEFCELPWDRKMVHPHVQSIIDSTGGYMYQPCKGKLTEYPIPRIRVNKRGNSQLMIDCGCNWGRWTFSASRLGIPAVGVDPSLGAIAAARSIRTQLGLTCSFFVGDCRWLPFRSSFFTDVFSYSVVQHFSKEDARTAVTEFHRLLCDHGQCMIQMPNCFGVRSAYHLAKRRFRSGKSFDVRYYTPGELGRLFDSVFGNANLSVDGFFGLGIQADDMRFMPLLYRVIICASELLRFTSKVLPPLKYLADSLYVSSVRESLGKGIQ